MTLPLSEREAFQDALLNAIEEKITAAVFTPEQRAEMEKPFREKYDFYNAQLMCSAGATLPFDMMPQLAITDPRVTDEQIAAAPKKLSFEFNGVAYEAPIRIYKTGSRDIAEWEEGINTKAFMREHADKLKPALEQALGPKLDFSIGYLGTRPPYFLIQAWNKANYRNPTNAQFNKIEAAANAALAQQLGDKPFKVRVSGPVRMH